MCGNQLFSFPLCEWLMCHKRHAVSLPKK
jgi:hypothetical protein